MGRKLRAYLARLASTLLTSAARAEQARAALRAWNGYDPTEADIARLDDELDRRLAKTRTAQAVRGRPVSRGTGYFRDL